MQHRLRHVKAPHFLKKHGKAILIGLVSIALLYGLLVPPQVTILILGMDARPGEGFATRTDTILLLSLQTRRMRMSMLSIPRDVFLDVEGYGSQRINTINVLGELEESGSGARWVAQAIEDNFNLDIDRTVRLNFDAFVQLVDAIGGVVIEVEHAIVDPAFPTEDFGTMVLRFDEGKQRMDGITALRFARTRHGDDDYARIQRQQQVLQALVAKLVLPWHGWAIIHVFGQNVETNLNPLDVVSYLPTVVFSAGKFERLSLNREDLLPGANGAIPNYSRLDPWLAEHFR
ncbi:MAG: LCP family protein [Phototrophicaceae bacterium]